MKRLLSLLLAAMLLASLTPVLAEEVPTLKWVSLGGGMPDNYETWKAKVDEYLVEKIGVKLDAEILSWGAYGEKRNAIINGGEYFDIIFTDGGSYFGDIDKNALLDIKPLLDTAAPELKATLPEGMWDAVTVKDAIYAVPTMKDSALAHYFVFDPEVVKDIGIDVEQLHTLESLEPLFLKMKEQGVAAPYTMNKGGSYHFLDVYDTIGLGTPLVGVRYDDESRQVVSVFETEEIQKTLSLLHKWNKEGIINSDASTLAESPANLPFFVAQGWPKAWKVFDKVGLTSLFVGPIFSNNSVMGSMNGVYSGTNHPEKAMEFLQLVNTDTKLRDMLCYGEEGVNFEYKDGLVIQNADKPWPWARYTQGNHAILTPGSDDPEILKNMTSVNESAQNSVMLGFNVDRSEIEDQLTYMKAVYEKYLAELLTGTRAPEEIVPQMVAELDAGGMRDVIANVQAQIDAAFAE